MHVSTATVRGGERVQLKFHYYFFSRLWASMSVSCHCKEEEEYVNGDKWSPETNGTVWTRAWLWCPNTVISNYFANRMLLSACDIDISIRQRSVDDETGCLAKLSGYCRRPRCEKSI